MSEFVFDLQRFAAKEEVFFNRSGFLDELNKLRTNVNSYFVNKLKSEVKEEATARLTTKYPGKSLEAFKKNVTITGGSKDDLPKEVWQAIMEGAAAKKKAITDIPFISGLRLDADAGKILKAVGGYLYSFLQNETVPVKADNNTYKVNVTAYSSATVTRGSKSYTLTWKDNTSAQTALNNFVKELGNYFEDSYVQAYVDIAKGGLNDVLDDVFNILGKQHDGIAESVFKAIKEYVETLTGEGIDNIYNLFDKKSAPVQTINAFNKKYSAFLDKMDALKNSVGKTDKYTSTVAKQFDNLVAAYNQLDVEGNIDGLIDKYLSYTISEVTSGEYNQSNAQISGTDDSNQIEATGSGVVINGFGGSVSLIAMGSATVNGGVGDDTIAVYSSKSKALGEEGNDLLFTFASQSTLEGGNGNDKLIVGNSNSNTKLDGGVGDDLIAAYGSRNTIVGGAGNDTILLIGVEETLIEYEKGHGNDTIVGYDEYTTLKISDSYATATSGHDVIISVGNSSINLFGVGGKKININNTNQVIGNPYSGLTTSYTLPNFYGSAQAVTYGTAGDDSIKNYRSNVLINTGAGNDTIDNYGEDVTIDAGAGNDSIYNYYGWNVSIDAGDDSLRAATATIKFSASMMMTLCKSAAARAPILPRKAAMI